MVMMPKSALIVFSSLNFCSSALSACTYCLGYFLILFSSATNYFPLLIYYSLVFIASVVGLYLFEMDAFFTYSLSCFFIGMSSQFDRLEDPLSCLLYDCGFDFYFCLPYVGYDTLCANMV